MDTSGFFDTFFENAKYNGIVIMQTDGAIININEAFHLRFGYKVEDLKGKNFTVLFTEKDQAINKPERELQSVITDGSASDENYLMHKDGNKVWVTGESVLIENVEGEDFIVKVVHNIHAQKQLERFLLQSHEFIDTVFDSIDESGLLLLDSRLRIIKANKTFAEIFQLKQPIAAGSRLADLDNEFWQKPEVKQEIVNYLVRENNYALKIFDLNEKQKDSKKINMQGKLVEGTQGAERKLLVMIKYVD